MCPLEQPCSRSKNEPPSKTLILPALITAPICLSKLKKVERLWAYQVANAVDVPIIGMGGISTAEDALEFIMAGATAVSVGTANFINPATTLEVVDGIKTYMERHQINDINELIGCVK